jgi:hypothetical protein
MRGFGALSRGIAIATLLCFAAPPAQAIEMYGLGTAATGLDDGLLVEVHNGGARRGGGTRHGGDRGMTRGGGYAHRGNVHGANHYGARNVYRNGNRNVYR